MIFCAEGQECADKPAGRHDEAHTKQDPPGSALEGDMHLGGGGRGGGWERWVEVYGHGWVKGGEEGGGRTTGVGSSSRGWAADGGEEGRRGRGGQAGWAAGDGRVQVGSRAPSPGS